MEIQVSLDEPFCIRSRIHHHDRFAHRGTPVFVRALCSQCRDSRLEDLSHFNKLHSAFGGTSADDATQTVAHRTRGVIRCDKRATTRIGFHQSFFAQSFQSFTNCGAADTKLPCEVSLGGQLFSRFQISLEHGVFNLLNDLLVQARALYNLIHRNSLARQLENAMPDRKWLICPTTIQQATVLLQCLEKGEILGLLVLEEANP